ncbi:MAG: DNA/RNA non-specific endonuclease, partial [Gemmatimonadales bacterium]
AGAMFALGETASGAVVLANFVDIMDRVTPLAAAADIKYVAVAKGEVTATATIGANGVATGVTSGDAGIVATAPNGVAGTAALHVDAAPPPSGLPETRFSELHYDNTGTDVGESIELEGAAGTDLTGWTIVLYDGNGGATYNTQTLGQVIPATCGARGVVFLSYPTNGIQNGSPDGMALVNPSGGVVEFLSYEGTFTATNGPANGILSTDIVASEASSSPIGQSLQRNAANVWSLATSSFGSCNGGGPPPPPASTITFSGRLPSDPPLPVGFEDQLFGTLHDGSGATVPTTLIWTAETPALASIDQNGVMHALGAGTATFRATAGDGTTATYSLPTRVAVASTTAQYAGNAEFGEPADGDPSDDFIVRHDEYTSSYNSSRGSPNWVSYDLEATHFGPEDRCDCFTFDPALPASFPQYTTADYTGAGAIAGYGIDRGHLARSFDRTSASLDNAYTFYFSNVVPQVADLNQGPWASFENYLGDLARFSDKEVYIIAGASGNKGTIKNEGKITIPTHTWKVAVIMPRNHGLGDVHSYQDVQVIAVVMPNEPGIRNVPWENYQTTVDAVEALSGYDLLARLPDPIEIAVESNTKPPVARTDGPYTSLPHLALVMSGASSSDPDGDALTFDWSFGDGAAQSGVSVAHAYASAGTFTIRLIATDIRGLADTTFTSAAVQAPAQTLADAQAAVDQLLGNHAIDAGDGKWLTNKLGLTSKLLGQATTVAAVNQLEEVLRRLPDMGPGTSALANTVRELIQSLTS